MEAALIPLALLMFVAATLYASVGHGGASAYLGAMSLFALAPEVMRPTALSLNLLVAGIAALRLLRDGQFNLRLFLLFTAGALPAAFVGGTIALPGDVYRPLLGALLCAAALRLLWAPAVPADAEVRTPRAAVAIPAGTGLGLLAGLTGTGGGIFLSPLILLNRWETPRRTSGVAALFILANSAAGLAGNVAMLNRLPTELPVFLAAVGAGAGLGAWLGVRRLPQRRLEQALSIVLSLAGAKLLLS